MWGRRMRCSLSVVAIALLGSLPAKASVWDAACLNGLPSGRPCVDIGNSIVEFRKQIENAGDGDFIVFCPFNIQHDGTKINPSSRSGFACDPRLGECVINGPGQLLLSVSSPQSETLFSGFTFLGFDDAVVFIREAATKEQLFCDCVFEGNSHKSRGGALRSSAGTTMTIRSSTFKDNSAGRGGAIYNRGNTTVIDSVFVGNSGIDGGAVASASYASIFVSSCLFEGNSATDEGPVLWGEFSPDDFETEYIDGGWNIASNNGGCEGLFNSDGNTCTEFEFTGTFAPTISASPTASPTGAPSLDPTRVPSTTPTFAPSGAPSAAPSSIPSMTPSRVPSGFPSQSQSPSNLEPSASPAPSTQPTSSALPSESPSDEPSIRPSVTPSVIPTDDPTQFPSSAPSMLPTDEPSVGPSQFPSDVPSLTPTLFPTSTPSVTPTMAPTPTYSPPPDPELEILPLVDRDQPRGYFNFNMDDPDFGPNAWGKIDVSDNEFKRYEDEERGFDVSQNECGRGGVQSPIDLSGTNAACEEFHQIRARGGDWRNMTRSGNIVFQVTPRNLRMQIEGDSSKGPRADSPGGFVELYLNHLEVHVPSLHTFEGRRFDAEYSLYHIHGSKDRSLVLSVLVDASVDRYNHQFQKMLNAWGQVQGCGIEAGRRLNEMDIYDDADEETVVPEEEHARRLVSIGGKHNVYHVDLIPSIHWYAYDGSLVQPPCTRNANWRVYDTPMEISVAQLRQLRGILNDGPCRDDPFRAGLGNSMVRPTERDRGRDVWRCNEGDFLSDCERFGILCPAPGFSGS